ncbi:MAG: glycosyltransferase family 2 protein [Flavobacteriaceae bacterium]|nr:glycosyltransferase family 2 protein [Flavobacteriaceae bacterium]
MISALAISYNEEAHIEKFIKSLSFADEIIIVDSDSTDNTVELAKSLGAIVLIRDFDNFSNQKNLALQQAKHEWVVFFDLDESINQDLAEEIKSSIANPGTADAFKVKRNFYFMGKCIKYSGFQNDAVVRIFKKSKAKYSNSLVHETLEIDGNIGSLKHRSDHFSYKGFDHYNNKLTHYSKLQAKALYNKNVRPNLYHFLIRPCYRFWHQYLIRLGFLDGKEGFILAYTSAFAVFKRYLYLWTMYRNIE